MSEEIARQENEELRRQILDLKRQLDDRTNSTRTGARDETQLSHMVKILELRDRQLEQYASDLQAKNQQLQLWISSLELYQHIFESDPNCLIGVNRELKVVLYNKATLDAMGETIKDAIGKKISEMNFTRLDPYIPVLAEEALKGGRVMAREIARSQTRVVTRCYPLGSMREIRGVLLRIGVVPA
jgi:PAS domain-containing protein